MEYIPHGIRLLPNHIEGTNIPPKLLFYTDNIIHGLNDRGAEVHGEVRIIVITSGVPAFYPVIFVRFLVIYQGLDCHGVEVIGVSIGGIVDGTWFRLFRVCCEGCRAEEEREEGGGEVGAHCDLRRRVVQSEQGREALFLDSYNIISSISLNGERLG